MQNNWKRINLIKGYEDILSYYEVSENGEFRTVDFTYTDKNGVEYNRKGKTLTLSYESGKSPRVVLKNNTRNVTKNAAAIVARAFIDNPNNYLSLVFRDSDYTNITSSNLYWDDANNPKYDKIESLPNEIWKDIADAPNYSVSNLGRIKAKARNYFISGGSDVMSIKEAYLLSPTFEERSGYYSVGLSINNKTVTRRVHRIVAETFIPNPNNLPQVDHINENKGDNTVTNLRWVTNKENSIHSNSTKIVVTFPDGNIQLCDSIAQAALISGYNERSISVHCQRESKQKENGFGFRWLNPKDNSKISKKELEKEIELELSKYPKNYEYIIKYCNTTPNYHNIIKTNCSDLPLAIIWKKSNKENIDYSTLVTIPIEYFYELLKYIKK